jgi:DNA-binding transcriptional LysR family regulator
MTPPKSRLKQSRAGDGAGHSALRPPREPLPFDFRSLEIFLAVAETGNFTEAGRRLGLTQSAVSQAVGQLERQFGVVLIDRKLKPQVLTIPGTVLRKQAHELLDEARRVVSMIRESVSAKLPIVRIGLIESLFPVLAPVLGIELRPYAHQLSMLSGVSHFHREGLLQRSIDISITPEPMYEVDGLDRFALLEEPFILLLPASRQGRDNSDLSRLAAELPFIWYTDRSHMGHQIGLHLRRLRLELPRAQAYDSTSGVVSMVAAGLGWAITTPLCMIDIQPVADSVFCAPLPAPAMSRQLMLVRAQRRDGWHTGAHRRADAARAGNALRSGDRPDVSVGGDEVQGRSIVRTRARVSRRSCVLCRKATELPFKQARYLCRLARWRVARPAKTNGRRKRSAISR